MRIALIAVIQLFLTAAYCQNLTYNSRVIDSENNSVAFATIQEMNSNNVVTSDERGNFTIKISNKNFDLKITSIGFEAVIVSVVNGQLPKSISLNTSAELLDQVVVTALGIERNRQSLGSSVTKISTKELNEVPLTNLVNSLAGQIAGVQVTNGSSGVGSSSRIVIRGENSLSGSNQPLFVVDGVPISNEQITSNLVNRGALQEVDYGNGGADINPDDIESVTILKGAGSAALYGTRAANGVVVITTKRGKRANGIGVSLSSSLTFEDILTMPDYQNVYGGGGNGDYSFQNGIGGGVRDGGISSYGPKLDQGLLINQFDSPSVDVNENPVRAGDVIARQKSDGSFTPITPTPWVSKPNNVRDFFKIGVTSQTSVAVNSATESNNTRISYSNLR
ncbi:MAG: TonB-dependent receptor plug domain-containing protein, partial [Spirosomataceae bacterium]